MNKNILLAAAALSVLATAGAANAASITARVGSGTGAVAVTPTVAPYRLARELNYSAGISSAVGEFDTIVTANNALTPGTYTITLTYSGATIRTALGTGAVTQPTSAPTNTAAAGFEAAAAASASAATLTLASGGSVGSNSVTYTLQVPAGGTVSSVYFAPALNVTGPVSVTASITNQVTGVAVDPAVSVPLITNTAQGFAAVVTPDANDTVIQPGASAAFRTLSEPNIGTVEIRAASADNSLGANSVIAYKDLNATAVSLADVTGSNLIVTGNLTNVNVAATAGTVSETGNTATITQTAPVASPNTISLVVDSATTGQIAPSQYSVSGTYTLSPTFSGPITVASSALETVDAEGLNYVVPWVSSRTQGASTGSRTVIRISRVGTANLTGGGNVYAQVINPLRGSASGSYALVGTLPAGSGELVLSSDTLENAFGDFGRADIRLAITPRSGANYTNSFTPAANDVIVKRVISQPNGGVSEMDVVAVGALNSAVPVVGF